jgi:hypothetical protein
LFPPTANAVDVYESINDKMNIINIFCISLNLLRVTGYGLQVARTISTLSLRIE